MALSPTYTRLIDYTLPTVSGSHPDFVMLLKYDDFNVGDALNFIDNGGGDLRFSSDEAGNNQLPCHVIDFDKVGNQIFVKVKVPSAFTGQVIYIWGDNTGDTQPVVTDPYGRNAVYSQTPFILNGGSFSDSSGNNNNVTGYNGATENSGVANPASESSVNLDGVDDYLRINTETNLSISDNNDITFEAWVKTNNTGRGIILGNHETNIAINLEIYTGGLLRAYLRTSLDSSSELKDYRTTTSFNDNTWHLVGFTYSGTTQELKLFIDGSEQAVTKPKDTTLSGSMNTSKTHVIGKDNRAYNIHYFDGEVANVAVHRLFKSPNLIATEYDNQSSTGAWGVPTRYSGGGATTIITMSGTISLTSGIDVVTAKVTNLDVSIPLSAGVTDDSVKISNQSVEIGLITDVDDVTSKLTTQSETLSTSTDVSDVSNKISNQAETLSISVDVDSIVTKISNQAEVILQAGVVGMNVGVDSQINKISNQAEVISLNNDVVPNAIKLSNQSVKISLQGVIAGGFTKISNQSSSINLTNDVNSTLSKVSQLALTLPIGLDAEGALLPEGVEIVEVSLSFEGVLITEVTFTGVLKGIQ